MRERQRWMLRGWGRLAWWLIAAIHAVPLARTTAAFVHDPGSRLLETLGPAVVLAVVVAVCIQRATASGASRLTGSVQGRLAILLAVAVAHHDVVGPTAPALPAETPVVAVVLGTGGLVATQWWRRRRAGHLDWLGDLLASCVRGQDILARCGVGAVARPTPGFVTGRRTTAAPRGPPCVGMASIPR